MLPFRLSLIFASALTLAGCGISGPMNVAGLRTVVGDELPGAQGLTLDDQFKIDVTVARLCAKDVRIFGRELCDKHTEASAARRAQ